MKGRILCSTGAFIGGRNGRNHLLIEEYASKIHCDGFEFMMYPSWYEHIERIGTDLSEMKVELPVFHVDKGIGERISRNEEGDMEIAYQLFEMNCELAAKIGSKLMVLHLWGGRWSDGQIDVNIECFGRLNQIAKGHGQLLTVENVVCNRKDPMTHLHELLYEYSDITFTFDTKMAAFHEQLSTIYEKENEVFWDGNHIRHMHINDYGGGYMDWGNLMALHIGEGHIDFETFFRFIKEKGYSGDFTVEATSLCSDGVVDFDSLNASLDKIRNWIME